MDTLEKMDTLLEELNTLEEQHLIKNHFEVNASELVSFLKGCDNVGNTQAKVLIKVCEIYAYYGKFAEVRSLITRHQPSLFSDLCTFYTQSKFNLTSGGFKDEALQLEYQFLRALGNLTIDDDMSRQKVLDTGILTPIVKGLNGTHDHDVGRVRLGCLLNLSLGFSPARKEILSSICFKTLLASLSLEHLDAKQFMPVYLGLELLSNLFEEENCPKLFSENDSNVRNLVKMLSFYRIDAGELDVRILNVLVDIIEATLNNDEALLSTLALDGSLKSICDFLEASTVTCERYPQSREELTTMLTTVERVIVLITSQDDSLVLFDDDEFMQRISTWLNQTDNLQLTSCAALVLGNLARTDRNCTRMVVELELHLKLVSILGTTTDLGLLHAVVGILKNLSVPVENKKLLGKTGLIRQVAPLLEKQVAKPLQFGAAGLLKHLSNRNDANALAMCSTENEVDGVLPIARLRNVIQKSDDLGVRSEATRAMMNIVRAVYGTRHNFDHFGKILTDNAAVQPVMELVMQTKFPSLQNEALVTLALLASVPSPEVETMVSALTEASTELSSSADGILTERDALGLVPLAKAIEDILFATERAYAAEMRLNALAFLNQILSHGLNLDGATFEKLWSRFLPALKSLSSGGDVSLRAAAEKILADYS